MTTDSEELNQAPGLDDAGAHLDGFVVSDDAADFADTDFVPVGEDGAPVAFDQEPGVMGLDAWTATWELAWNVPGMVIPKYAPLGITPEKQQASDTAAQAVYELAQEHFPWMIEEKGGVFGAVMAIGPFAAVQFGAFRQIQAEEQRQAREAQKAAQEAGNTDAPPVFKSTRAGEAAAPPEAANTDAPPSGAGLEWMDQENAA